MTDILRVPRVALTAALLSATSPVAAQTPTPQPQPTEWAKLPRMVLERQFAGPLQDTIIQRWRDPADNTVCYVYLPITVAHTPPTPAGYVQYGSNTIGSLSCVAGNIIPAPKTVQPPAAALPKPK